MMKMDLSKLYSITKDDRVFLDTNILIFLFSPFNMSKDYEHQKEKYSEIFALLVKNKSTLYINSLVISEFINKNLRLDFNKNFNKSGDKDFKDDYRGSEPYKKTLKSIITELKKILKFTNKLNDDIEQLDILKEYTSDLNLDFNDVIIADTVIKHELKILTDDKDFEDYKGIKLEWYYR